MCQQSWFMFIHSVFCLMTGPKPPPKRFLHIVRSRASSFKWEYPLLSLRSSSSFLRLLLPRLLVTSISPFILLLSMYSLIVVYVFLLFVRVFLTLSMYSYCCLWILIVRPCIRIVVYVFLLLSMYSYRCLCILIVRPCILIVVYVYLLLSTYS